MWLIQRFLDQQRAHDRLWVQEKYDGPSVKVFLEAPNCCAARGGGGHKAYLEQQVRSFARNSCLHFESTVFRINQLEINTMIFLKD
jgi:hypothetical protein